MRAWFPLVVAIGLAGCGTTIPDSGAGVGFGDYDSYQEGQRRDAALASSQRPVTVQPPAEGSSSGTGAPSAAEIDAALGTNTAATQRTAEPSSGPPVSEVITPAPGSSARISDEQSFEAVSSRESIESDAQRIARQRAQFEQAPVTALPDRPEDTGPNLAEYALSTTNQPGEKIYSRGFTSQRKYDRNCGSHSSAAMAQRAFLAAGGPQRDRMGMDPDGDGFACGWDPRPFRAARG